MNNHDTDPKPVAASNGGGPGQTESLQNRALVRAQETVGLVLRPVRDIIAYDPKPLAKPLVDEALDELGFLHRSAETIRYNLACLELRLWPGGHLRAYVWLILSLLLGFAIPAAACLLALTVVTPIFGYAAAILGFVENGTRSAMMATLYVVGTIVLGLVGLHIAKSLFRAWQRRPVGNGVRRLRD